MDIIFDVFSETYVRLLTSISSQFFSRYSKNHNKSHNKKVLKAQRPLTKRRAALEMPNFMYLVQLDKCSLQ